MDSNAKVMMLCYKTAANQMIKQKQENDNGAHYRIIGIAYRFILHSFLMSWCRLKVWPQLLASPGLICAHPTPLPSLLFVVWPRQLVILPNKKTSLLVHLQLMSFSLASDLAPHNITANSIAVGFVGGTKMCKASIFNTGVPPFLPSSSAYPWRSRWRDIRPSWRRMAVSCRQVDQIRTPWQTPTCCPCSLLFGCRGRRMDHG